MDNGPGINIRAVFFFKIENREELRWDGRNVKKRGKRKKRGELE